MNIDQVREIISSPRRDRSRSRASTAATTSLKRSREFDDAVSGCSPLMGGDGIPAWKKTAKTAKTASFPVLSLSGSNESTVSADKRKQVATTPLSSTATALPEASSSAIVLDSVNGVELVASGSSYPTRLSKTINRDSLISDVSPQEWVMSQAQSKRKRSQSEDIHEGLSSIVEQSNISSSSARFKVQPTPPPPTPQKNCNHNVVVTPKGKGRRARPATLGTGTSFDTAIEIMSSASSSSSVEVLEERCRWAVKPSSKKIDRSLSPLLTPPLNMKKSLSQRPFLEFTIVSGPSAASGSQSRRPVSSTRLIASKATPQSNFQSSLCGVPTPTPALAESQSLQPLLLHKSPTSSSSVTPASSCSLPIAKKSTISAAPLRTSEDDRARLIGSQATSSKTLRARRSATFVDADKCEPVQVESSVRSVGLSMTTRRTAADGDHAFTPQRAPFLPLPTTYLPSEFGDAGSAMSQRARLAPWEKIDENDQKLRGISRKQQLKAMVPDMVKPEEKSTSARKESAAIHDLSLPSSQTTFNSNSLASHPQSDYNVFGDRCTPESMHKDRSTPNSTRSVVNSSEPGERLPPIGDYEEWHARRASPKKSASSKEREQETPSDQDDVFNDFADFVWTEPAAPVAENETAMTAQHEEKLAEPPLEMLPDTTRKNRTDESMVSEALHISIISTDDGSDVLAMGTPLRSVADRSLASMDSPLASPASPAKETEVRTGGRSGADGEENPASKVSTAARIRAMLLVAQAAEEREATLEAERQARTKAAETKAVENEEEDLVLPSLDDIISNVQTAKPLASVGHLLPARANSSASSSKGSDHSTPPISAKPAPSEMDKQFSTMVQQRNRDIRTGTGLALFREVQSYEQRAPYPTPDLSISPSPNQGKPFNATRGPSLQELYGGWKGFWDEANPCVQPNVQHGEQSSGTEIVDAALEKVLFGDDAVAALAALAMPQQSFSDQDVKLLESAPSRLYEGRQNGKTSNSVQQVTLWVNLLRQMFRTSGSDVIKSFIVPLVLLNVDYDSSLALRLDTMSAVAEGLTRLSDDDYKPVMNDLLQETTQYGRGLQLGIAEALGRGPVMIKRFSQWYAALSLKAETAPELFDEWSSKTDIPSPMNLTHHLRNQMLHLVSEDVAKASDGDSTYSNSMTAFRLLAIALQDIEAILSAVAEAAEDQDPLKVLTMRQNWLDETRSFLREALETIPDERGNFTEVTLLKRHIKGLESKLDFHGRTFMTRFSTTSRGNGLRKGTQTKLQIRRKVVS